MTNSATTTTAHYTVCVREWFDRTYGNTYHTMRIVGTNGIDTVIPFSYGHGELLYLEKASYWVGISPEAFRAMEWAERRAMFTLEIVTVKAKRDLHEGGK